MKTQAGMKIAAVLAVSVLGEGNVSLRGHHDFVARGNEGVDTEMIKRRFLQPRREENGPPRREGDEDRPPGYDKNENRSSRREGDEKADKKADKKVRGDNDKKADKKADKNKKADKKVGGHKNSNIDLNVEEGDKKWPVDDEGNRIRIDGENRPPQLGEDENVLIIRPVEEPPTYALPENLSEATPEQKQKAKARADNLSNILGESTEASVDLPPELVDSLSIIDPSEASEEQLYQAVKEFEKQDKLRKAKKKNEQGTIALPENFEAQTEEQQVQIIEEAEKKADVQRQAQKIPMSSLPPNFNFQSVEEQVEIVENYKISTAMSEYLERKGLDTEFLPDNVSELPPLEQSKALREAKEKEKLLAFAEKEGLPGETPVEELREAHKSRRKAKNSEKPSKEIDDFLQKANIPPEDLPAGWDIFSDQGKWEVVDELKVQAVEEFVSLNPDAELPDHFETLDLDLAYAYVSGGALVEADEASVKAEQSKESAAFLAAHLSWGSHFAILCAL